MSQCGRAVDMLGSPAQWIAAEQAGRTTSECSDARMIAVAKSTSIMAQIMADGPSLCFDQS